MNKTMWLTVGLGALVAAVGALMATVGRNYNLGVLIILIGMVIAVFGIIARIVMVFIGDKVK